MGNDNALKGVIMVSASNVAFCGMVWLIRYSSYLNIQTTALFRFIIGMGVVGILAMTGKAKLSFVNKKGLLVRGLFGGIAVWMCFVSIDKLGLIKSSIIGYSYPLFATIFSAIWLKEKVGIGKLLCLALAFTGLFMVLLCRNNAGCTMGFGFWEGFCLLGAMLGGLTVVLVKKLQDTDSTVSIFFSQCLVGFWLMLIPSTAAPLDCGYSGCIVLLCIGLLAATGQLIMTEGYRHVTVASGSIITLLSPVLNIIVGAILFHEAFPPMAMAGSLVLLLSIGGSVVNEHRNK